MTPSGGRNVDSVVDSGGEANVIQSLVDFGSDDPSLRATAAKKPSGAMNSNNESQRHHDFEGEASTFDDIAMTSTTVVAATSVDDIATPSGEGNVDSVAHSEGEAVEAQSFDLGSNDLPLQKTVTKKPSGAMKRKLAAQRRELTSQMAAECKAEEAGRDVMDLMTYISEFEPRCVCGSCVAVEVGKKERCGVCKARVKGTQTLKCPKKCLPPACLNCCRARYGGESLSTVLGEDSEEAMREA